MSMPPTQNPLTLLLWLFGVPGGIAFLTLLVKGIWFVAKASTKLDAIDELAREFKEYRHSTNDNAQAVELSLTIIESDVNALQAKTGIALRAFPDRRVGPADRRAAS
jgi:hypothetical protein